MNNGRESNNRNMHAALAINGTLILAIINMYLLWYFYFAESLSPVD